MGRLFRTLIGARRGWEEEEEEYHRWALRPCIVGGRERLQTLRNFGPGFGVFTPHVKRALYEEAELRDTAKAVDLA